jgi:hypothetical protein
LLLAAIPIINQRFNNCYATLFQLITLQERKPLSKQANTPTEKLTKHTTKVGAKNKQHQKKSEANFKKSQPQEPAQPVNLPFQTDS